MESFSLDKFNKELFLEWKQRYENGEKIVIIADECGRSVKFVREHINNPDAPVRKPRPYRITDEMILRIKEDCKAGLSAEEIAEKNEISVSSVCKYADHSFMGISLAQIKEMRRLYCQEHVAISDIAEMYNLTERTVESYIYNNSRMSPGTQRLLSKKWDETIAEFKKNIEAAEQRNAKKRLPVSSSGRTFWK